MAGRSHVPRTTDAPIITTLLVGDDGVPSTGAVEPAIVPIAAAISNAVFHLNRRAPPRAPHRPYLGQPGPSR